MRRIGLVIGLLSLTAMPLAAAAEGGGHASKEMSKQMKSAESTTVQGEIVDMGCYLGHGAKGAKHKACATKCIAGGMPMGLLTDDGELYLLTMNHDNHDPFDAAKQMAAETVRVTGPVHERDGMLSLEVTAVEKAGAKS